MTNLARKGQRNTIAYDLLAPGSGQKDVFTLPSSNHITKTQHGERKTKKHSMDLGQQSKLVTQNQAGLRDGVVVP
jgi:hypothetical protein